MAQLKSRTVSVDSCKSTVSARKIASKARKAAYREKQARRLGLAGPPGSGSSNTDTELDRAKLQARGAQLAKWIDNPNEPDCPVSQSTLTMKQIREMGNPVADARRSRFKEPFDGLAKVKRNLFLSPELVENDQRLTTYISYDIRYYERFKEEEEEWKGAESRQRAIEKADQKSNWKGIIAPGFIAMEFLTRNPESKRVPHLSETSIATYLYENRTMDNLKYIFINSIVHEETWGFVKRQAYAAWPGQPKTWLHGSQVYEELLGTKMGRTVAYIVLGAFPRGSRRITQITTYCTSKYNQLNMRFDIAPPKFISSS